MQNLNPDIFQFAHPREFLVEVLASKKKLNPGFSIRAWSRLIGYKNPAVLAKVIKGERRLNLTLAEKLANSLKLRVDEWEYFKYLVLVSNAESEVERRIYQETLEANFPKSSYFQQKSIDLFRMISDWYYLPILEMVTLEEFEPDPRWIAKKLFHKVSPQQVSVAIDRLLRLELLEEKNGKLRRTETPYFFGNEMSSEVIQKYHKAALQRADEAILEQNVEERSFMASTFVIATEDLPRLQKLLKSFHEKIQKDFERKKGGNSVYQFNTQFFKVCEPVNKRRKGKK